MSDEQLAVVADVLAAMGAEDFRGLRGAAPPSDGECAASSTDHCCGRTVNVVARPGDFPGRLEELIWERVPGRSPPRRPGSVQHQEPQDAVGWLRPFVGPRGRA